MRRALGGLVLAIVTTGHAAYSQAGPATLRQTAQGEHVVVDSASPSASAFSGLARPTLLSTARLVRSERLSNVRIELPVEAGCGYADGRHLVVCLDADYHLAPADQLRLLAFARGPVRATAGSERAAALLRNLVAGQGSFGSPEGVAVTDAGCRGDCARRLSLELQ